MGRKYLTMDCSRSTALPVCACGWRQGPFLSRQDGLVAYAKHRAQEHPKQAADAASADRRRP